MKVRMALAALAGVAVLATVGVAATATSAGASTTRTTVSHTTYAPRDCAGWQLSATLTRGPKTWGNNRELVLALTNTSRSACTVSGYPGLQLLGAGHQALPTTVVKVPGAQIPERTWGPAGIVLLPGQSATADITFTVQGRLHPALNYPGPPFFPVSAAYLVVTLPNGYPGHVPPFGPRFVLRIPGGLVPIVQYRLYETALAGQFPVFR
ncbi:MAG TPA: DUF4232 domain-containing protein [Streptosporangiaceae bacterium]|nr:DUF4232 domain-containing protein [Streptosporangiaceae bacterium]